jgi:exodeoxyribonuclease V beta subunit
MFENVLLISAAGSGKTRELTKMWIFHYLSKENSSLRTIYGVTFTNEAVFEMKSRILKYLDLLAKGEENIETSENEIIEEFKKIFPDIEERAKNKKKYLINNISDLNISTFHSLFSNFLSCIPFSAGILPGYRIIEQVEEDLIFEEVLDRFFEENKELSKNFEFISEMIEKKEINLKDRISKVYKSIFPYISFLENLIENEKNLRITKEENEKKFYEKLNEFKDFINKNIYAAHTKKGEIDGGFLKFLNKLEKISKKIDKETNFEFLWEKEFLEKNYIKKFRNNLSKKKEALFLNIFSNLQEFGKKYLISISDLQILSYLKPIIEIHKNFQREKLEKNLLSFSDIEIYTLSALKNNPETQYLYFKVGSEINHLFIDEFQDTNFIQLEILEPIICEITAGAPEQKSIFCVGDPNQAIFRFRGGVPTIFEVLEKKYSGKIKKKNLDVNYRSKEEIINFVNKILTKSDKYFENNKGGWVRVENLGNFGSKEEGRKKVLERVFEIVRELSENYGYEYSDIAILTRRNEFAEKVSEKLSEHNIPCRIRAKNTYILNENDVIFILNLLKFLDFPEDDFSLFHVLTSPVFNIKEELIRSLKGKGKNLYLALTNTYPDWEITKKLKRFLSLVGFLNPYELLYQIYKELKIEISYPLLTLLEIAYEYTKNGFNSLTSFINYLEKFGRAIEVKETISEGVNILTIHRAKGLEFEIVIIPETDYRFEEEDRYLLFSYSEDKTKVEKIYWREHCKCLEDIKSQEEKLLEEDELNLLYVAMTRAKSGLYIIGYKCRRNSKSLFLKILEKLENENYSSGEIIKKEKIEIKKEEKVYFKIIQDFPQIEEEEESLYFPTEELFGDIEDKRYAGMKFGEIVHTALSYVDWLDNVEMEKFIFDVIKSVKNIYTRDKEEEEEIEKFLRKILFNTFTDPDLKFIFFKDGKNREVRNELLIYFKEGKKDFSSRIDRIIIEDKKVLVVDYKLGEPKKEYKEQIKIYKKGVQKIYPDKKIEGILLYLWRKRGEKLEIL